MFEEEPKKKSAWGPIAAAVITAASAIVVAYINVILPRKIEIHATQTAEARSTLVFRASSDASSSFPEGGSDLATKETITPTPPSEFFSTSRLAGLTPYSSPGSSISFKIVPTSYGEGLEVSYNVGENQWAGFFRVIDPAALKETKGVRFSYMGSGAVNTLEFKMEYQQGTVFSALLPHASANMHWQDVEIFYDDLICWVNTPGCPENLSLRLDPGLVIKIGFAISNKPTNADEPGEGKVIFDNVQTIR